MSDSVVHLSPEATSVDNGDRRGRASGVRTL
jgi:hypothetical protein